MDVSSCSRVRRAAAAALTALALVAPVAVTQATGGSAVAAPRDRTPSPSTPDCGDPLARPDGGTWTCTFVDDFPGKELDRAKWSAMTTAATGTGLSECRVDDGDNIAVRGGALHLTVREERKPFLCQSPHGDYWTSHTAGAVTSYHGFSQAFGRFEVRARFPEVTVSGLHSAIWMWPRNARYGAASGEIDIAEFRTAMPDVVVPTLHYDGDDDDVNRTRWNCRVSRPGDFHTYAVEWTPDAITFLYDGQVCLTNTAWSPDAPLTRPAPFDEPYAINLNQSLGMGGNAYDPAATPLPATMQVDHVRVWK